MAITGTHTLLYSSEPENLRAMLRDVLALPTIDIGGGWMIFALPPSEIAVHPADGVVQHQFTLMCDNLANTVRDLKAKGVVVKTEPHAERWGVHVMLGLPGNCDVMLYEPRHPIAAGMATTKKTTAAKKKTTARPKPTGRPKKKAPRRR